TSIVKAPATAASAVPSPLRKMVSMSTPPSAAVQPMKIAVEYRFVTGGRPWMYMRAQIANVCTTSVTSVNQNAARRKESLELTHDTQQSRKTTTYKMVQ